MRLKVGDRRRIRFWEDVWCDNVALSNRFVDLYRISMASNFLIAEMFVPQSASEPYRWDLHFCRNFHDRELENYANLTALLDHVHLNGEFVDIRIWQPDYSGEFSSKSAFIALH